MLKRKFLVINLLLFSLLFCGNLKGQTDSGQNSLNKVYMELKALESDPLANEADRDKIVYELSDIMYSYPKQAPTAVLLMAESYSVSVPSQLRNLAKAAELYKKAAENLGDNPQLQALAYYNLALYYCSSTSVQNDSLAFEYNLKAADLDDAIASSVASCYSLGLGCEINPTLAMEYYRRSINVGQDCFMNYYAIKYFIDKLATDSLDEKAFGLYRDYQVQRARSFGSNDQSKLSMLSESAERGYAPAQLLMGTLYMTGEVGNDKATNALTAEKWMNRAIEQEYLPAYYQLGILYEKVYDSNGKLTQKSCTKAEPYFLKAAEKGFAPAQYRLGIYEKLGRMGASEVDYEDAEFWFYKAAAQGHREAEQQLKAVKNLIASKQTPASSVASVSAPKKKKKWWQILLTSLASASQVCADVSQRQQTLNTNQTKKMKAVSYSHSNGSSYNNSSSSSSNSTSHSAQLNYRNRNLEWNVYSQHESALMDMYYGHTSYSDNTRRSRQSSMRSIREKWNARGMGFTKSSWEDWNGICKVKR